MDIYLGRDKDSKQQRTTKTFYSLYEARKALATAKSDKAKGLAKTKVKAASITQLMEDFRKVHIELRTQKTTLYGYSVIENYFKAYLTDTTKNQRIDKITASVIDDYYLYLRNLKTSRLPNGMGANTICRHKHYLNMLFGYAHK